MLLAMNLPVSVPLWMPAVGAMFAIIVVKQLFGGLGKNFMNPALAARVFLFTAWPSHMTVFTKPWTVPVGARDKRRHSRYDRQRDAALDAENRRSL